MSNLTIIESMMAKFGISTATTTGAMMRMEKRREQTLRVTVIS